MPSQKNALSRPGPHKVKAEGLDNLYKSRKEDHPDMAYLGRYAHVCCSPFGAAEQRSRWWNKTPNLSERQRVFGVPPLVSSAREPAGPASSGVFILVLDKQKKYARRRAKAL